MQGARLRPLLFLLLEPPVQVAQLWLSVCLQALDCDLLPAQQDWLHLFAPSYSHQHFVLPLSIKSASISVSWLM